MMITEARRIDRNVYDIFLGKQWSDHIRVRQTRHGTHRVSGMRVDHATIREINEYLAPAMPITYGQTMQEMLHNNLAIQATR